MEKVGLKRWIASLSTMALAFVGAIDIASRWTDELGYQGAAGLAALFVAVYSRQWEWNAGFEVGKWSGRG